MMPHKDGQVYFEESQTLATSYKLGDDPRPLQLTFARLCDEAAQAIYRAGSDLDEVLVERILIARDNHETLHEVPADSLADAELLRQSVLKKLAVSPDPTETDVIEIVAVKIIARHDELTG